MDAVDPKMSIGSESAGFLKLAALIGDGMVAQAGQPIAVWGRGKAGSPLRAWMDGLSAETIVSGEGTFLLHLPAMASGGPYELRVECEAECLRIRDVLIGEVWLCGGQSNMQFPLSGSLDADADIAAAGLPDLRFFAVGRQVSALPMEEVPGAWQRCSPESAAAFSAVAFYAGRELLRYGHGPVGLILNAVGGTSAEAWTSLEGLEAVPGVAARVRDELAGTSLVVHPHEDAGIAPEAEGWSQCPVSDRAWKSMRIPQSWQSAGLKHNGAVWFRRLVCIPPAWAGETLRLSLGVADDHEQTWFNGTKVGATGPEHPSPYSHQRRYAVAGDLVREGVNEIAVRIFDMWGEGGLMGPADHMSLIGPDGGELSLAGTWEYRVEKALPLRSPEFGAPATHLFNGMLWPLRHLGLRGVLWYQGENNLNRANEYVGLFQALIHDWRRIFGRADLPFHFVQLPNCALRYPHPTGSTWAELREAQAKALALPHTAMVAAIDVGEEDIHPRSKRPVGLRLGLSILRHVYGHRELLAEGPRFAEGWVEGAVFHLRFEDDTGVLDVRGERLEGFALAGPDRVFHWAEADIQGLHIALSSPAVPEPVAARYAWANNPKATLCNRAGLPAFPFRTDDW